MENLGHPLLGVIAAQAIPIVPLGVIPLPGDRQARALKVIRAPQGVQEEAVHPHARAHQVIHHHHIAVQDILHPHIQATDNMSRELNATILDLDERISHSKNGIVEGTISDPSWAILSNQIVIMKALRILLDRIPDYDPGPNG